MFGSAGQQLINVTSHATIGLSEPIGGLSTRKEEEDWKDRPAGATMAYVERGVVKGKRTIWRLSIIPDFFKAVLNFIRMFFLTMFSIEKTDSYKKGYGGGKKWDGGPGGGGPGGGPYGGGGGGGGGPRGPRTLSDLRSNDQSSLPACGSCCG